jgi:polyhydroxyalkanoate synthesis regulator phasin
MERKRSTAGWAALAASMLIAGFPAAAQTVYKLIDKNGKITYSESEPKNFDGKVIRIDIDPNANKANLGAPPTDTGASHSAAQARGAARDTAKAQGHAAKVQEARERLQAAQDAYTEAKDHPVEGQDIRYIGNKSGGTRAEPTEAYQQRLDKLEREVKEAQNALQKLTAGN